MDPDRSWIFPLAVLLALLMQLLIWALGRAEMDDDERILGTPDAPLGLLALANGCFLGLGLHLSLPLLHWGAALGAALAGGFLAVLLFALGRVGRSEDKPLPAALYLPARLLGGFFAAPTKRFFSAARLTAKDPVTEEDILDLVEDVQEEAVLDDSQKEMISNVFELNDLEAGEIMTHRTEIEAVEDTDTAADAIRTAKEQGVSRLPVFRKNLDDIVGILHVKELLGLSEEQAAAIPVTDFARPAMFVPESCHARELLLDFKQKHTQIAIVVDEYGGTAGIVTMEDILEEIVGNIQDEFDNEEEEIRAVDGGFVTEGAADLEDIFERFGLEEPEREEDEDFDSVGGLLLQRLGRFPEEGETVEIRWGGITFKVLESGERRIETVLCTPDPDYKKDEDD